MCYCLGTARALKSLVLVVEVFKGRIPQNPSDLYRSRIGRRGLAKAIPPEDIMEHRLLRYRHLLPFIALHLICLGPRYQNDSRDPLLTTFDRHLSREC
jgi:hypothetical protein